MIVFAASFAKTSGWDYDTPAPLRIFGSQHRPRCHPDRDHDQRNQNQPDRAVFGHDVQRAAIHHLVARMGDRGDGRESDQSCSKGKSPIHPIHEVGPSW